MQVQELEQGLFVVQLEPEDLVELGKENLRRNMIGEETVFTDRITEALYGKILDDYECGKDHCCLRAEECLARKEPNKHAD